MAQSPAQGELVASAVPCVLQHPAKSMDAPGTLFGHHQLMGKRMHLSHSHSPGLLPPGCSIGIRHVEGRRSEPVQNYLGPLQAPYPMSSTLATLRCVPCLSLPFELPDFFHRDLGK